jgi:sterol desaturase/sphingolipid hydroxylase (fatty acid hydroxylase superfamily)
MNHWMQVFAGWQGFLALWSLAYALHLLLYFVPGAILERAARRNPERRLQARPPSDRARDIRQSVAALATISLYVAGGLWLQLSGLTLIAPWELSWWSVPLALLVTAIAYDTWFYWAHRLMHTKRMYRFHAQHHRAITPTPWSCNNDTLVGAFFEQAYFLLAPLVLPIPPAVLIAHKVYDQITCMISHCGHEYFAGPSARAPWPGLCTVFHDQHHAHFHWNFGNTFSFWDRWMGTMHPTYDRRVAELERIGTKAKA